MSKSTQKEPAESRASSVDFDDFIEDIFGLNIRSFKSIKALFLNPRDYFLAARTADWNDKYTPSLRIWLGLMAILLALKFIWASDDSETTKSFVDMALVMRDSAQQALESRGDSAVLDDFSPAEQGKLIFQRYVFIYPMIFVTMLSALAWIYRAWEGRPGFFERQRYIFAILIPGSVIGLISSILLLFFDGAAYMALSSVQLVFIVGIYFVTAYRGAYVHEDKGTRIGMSLVISILMFAALMAASLLSMLVSMVPSFLELRDLAQSAAGR